MQELLKDIKPALSSYTSTLGAISAADHPLLIAIPLGSGGESVILSVPWLQYLPLLPALKLYSASGVDEGFSSTTPGPSGVRRLGGRICKQTCNFLGLLESA